MDDLLGVDVGQSVADLVENLLLLAVRQGIMGDELGEGETVDVFEDYASGRSLAVLRLAGAFRWGGADFGDVFEAESLADVRMVEIIADVELFTD